MKEIILTAVTTLLIVFGIYHAVLLKFNPGECPRTSIAEGVDSTRLYLGQIQCSFRKQCLKLITPDDIRCGDNK